ncbi:hypothetical protein CIB95_08165 [Lottiidibacillus patelloidae]|uniref:N-acetyltransferase domain-containing protein n=2 Tax=Lottiidibacillus patelloidae TaxID=2670334 RepID=A0A263BWF0_9BACI|nr:hypothetical protein CIB95_08165 [Lottiidibacillus patelloidae]
MTSENAKEICSWKYEKPYDLYNMNTDVFEELMNNNYYEVINNECQLIGYFCLGKDAQVPGWGYNNGPIDIGLGLNPALTGRGLGAAFLLAGLKFAKLKLNKVNFRLTVATFNERAIKVYEKVGFIKRGEFLHSNTNQPFYVMDYQY